MFTARGGNSFSSHLTLFGSWNMRDKEKADVIAASCKLVVWWLCWELEAGGGGRIKEIRARKFLKEPLQIFF